MKKENVALVKRACRVCHEIVDSEVLLATKYDKDGEPINDLSKYHGKVVGFIEGTGKCDKCKEKTNGCIVIIGIDPEKSTNVPYPTGVQAFVKLDSNIGKHLLEEYSKFIIDDNIMYVEPAVMDTFKQLVK